MGASGEVTGEEAVVGGGRGSGGDCWGGEPQSRNIAKG